MSSAIFLDQQRAKTLIAKHGSPLYVYDLNALENRAKELLRYCQSLSCTPRYAIKANPHRDIIKLFSRLDLHFDASSDYEADEAIAAGVHPAKISLSSQQPPRDMKKTLQSGIKFVATSFHQLGIVEQTGWKDNIAVRLNPGLGTGHNRRTTTGGITSSFGIWHEYIPEVLDWQSKSGININRVHIHIGSGGDSKIWRTAIRLSLELIQQLPSVEILNMGGGYKIARLEDEKSADIGRIIIIFGSEIKNFATRTGRKLRLEIEPGTWLVGNAGLLLSRIVDIVDTGKNGFNFIKLDSGMNDLLRPAMYGAQHEVKILNDSIKTADYVVVGHNCETGDIFTPAPGDPEAIKPRKLNRASIGDLVVVGGAGAYGASMRAVGYNSFPSAAEIFINGSR
ncbi:diaminopimelate decarboxylase [Candidatus Saccharibacteria bacterium]|nr:diaminopimelate decarboxylase [Candidatus Saccharibacteria bacterium]